ncbi:YheO-like PAS domain [plant metagenome]|uniref:YheO-like PAS domain n=1 Tax=plant metagenome TaxID=1297885 RepID=A0A484SX06_9ZZZZ
MHDLSEPDKSIIAIANGQVSGRTVGAPITSMALQAIVNHSHETEDYRLNYAGLASGKLMRSSTLFIRDESGAGAGLLCINFDDSRYRELSERILKLRHPDIFVESNFVYDESAGALAAVPPAEEPEQFPRSLESLTDEVFDQVLDLPAQERLSHRRRYEIVRELDSKGFFRVRGAVKEVARRLGCSTATIYRYLARLAEETKVRGGP